MIQHKVQNYCKAPEGPEGLCKDSLKQPDGVTLFFCSEGKHVVWDCTCHDKICQTYVGGTSKEAGKAAEEAELIKIQNIMSWLLNLWWFRSQMRPLVAGAP